MGRKRLDYPNIINREETAADLRKIYDCEFWRCEYTKRKYILDLQSRSISKNYISNIVSGSEIIDKALDYVIYHSNIVLGIVGIDIDDRTEHYDYLEKFIIAYHNFLNNKNPKYCISSSVSMSNFEECHDRLSDGQKKSLRILHSDAREYGFFPADMTIIRHLDRVEKYIDNYFKEYGAYPNFQNPFLMKDDLDPDFNYKDVDGTQYFISENSDGIYIYMKCLDEADTLSKLALHAIALINTVVKNKPMRTAGDRDDADIQICIRNKKILNDKKTLKIVLEHNFAAYRNFICPEKFCYTTDTINVAKYLIVPEYEQISFNTRASGLYIWDKVHFYGEKISKSIEKARDVAAFNLHSGIEDKAIDRYYRLAKKSVERMSVLKFSDL